jgi:hypothetical protein
MRTVLISLAAAASALVVASPASAQYYPQPQPYGHAYGYNNYGHIRSLQARVNGLQRQIDNLDRRNIVSEREARKLREESRDIERRLFNASRNGLDPREFALLNGRIQRLERHIWQEARDGNRWGNRDGWNQNGWGQNAWIDRDRDGRNDRFEDDRGRDHD